MVVERKNRSLEELVRTMFNETNLPKYFWANVLSTTYFVMNCALIRPIIKQTTYELYKGRNMNISHLHVFEFKCFVLNNRKENLRKFDIKADERIFLRYSTYRKSLRVFNKRTPIIK